MEANELCKNCKWFRKCFSPTGICKEFSAKANVDEETLMIIEYKLDLLMRAAEYEKVVREQNDGEDYE